MARLVRKPSALKTEFLSLKQKLRKKIYALLIFIVTAVVGNLIMSSLYNVGLIMIGISVLGFLITLIMITTAQNNIIIKGQGVLGEDNSAEMLASMLDDSYTVFQNVVVTLDGKQSEIDLVVVGMNGIFAIEVKNRNGRIEGGYDNDRWFQHKTGRGGSDYSSDFYSPVKQVATHVFRLAGFLKKNGIRFFINGAVYFSNPEAVMRIDGQPDKIPVFSEADDLIRYRKLGNNPLPLDLKEKIIDLLK